MAGLAANVSDARGGQEQFQDSLQAQASQQHEQQIRDQFQAQLAQASRGSETRLVQPPQPTPAWTEGGGGTGQGGPTIYHPAGEQQLAPPAMAAWVQQHGGQAGVAGGAGAGQSVGGSRSASGHLPMNQQQALGQIDQMETQGMLNAAEAMRWRAQVHSGENPFGQQTAAEQQAALHMKQQLSPQQQAAQERQARLDQSREDREDYLAQKSALGELIASKEKQLKTALGDDRTQLTSEIAQHEKDLQALTTRYLQSRAQRRQGGQGGGQPAQQAGQGGQGGQGGADPLDQLRWQGNTLGATPLDAQGGVGAANDARGIMQGQATAQPNQGRPVTRDVIRQFIATSAGDVNAAKALARQNGFNPDDVLD